MATKVKSAAEIAEKWARIAGQRASDYAAGVTGAGTTWETNAKAAKAAYTSAVTAGNIGQMWAGGVARAGGAKYERKATGVGKDRYSGGVSAAVGDMQSGMEPMVQTIASVTPPARQPRGSEANLARVRAYATALNAKRLALRAAGG